MSTSNDITTIKANIDAAIATSEALQVNYSDKKAEVEKARTELAAVDSNDDDGKAAASVKLLNAVEEVTKAAKASWAQEEVVSTYRDQLQLEVKRIRDLGDESVQNPSTPLDSALITQLGIKDSPLRTKLAHETHAVKHPKDKRAAVKATDRLHLEAFFAKRIDTPISAGYGDGNGKDAGVNASTYLQNQETITTKLPKLMFEFDVGEYFNVIVVNDPTPGTLPSVALAGGTMVNMLDPENELSAETVQASASLMYFNTEYGDSDNAVIGQICKKVSSQSLYDAVKEEFEKLPIEKQLWQVFLWMLLKEATMMDTTTIGALSTWIARPDLEKSYGGNIHTLLTMFMKVLRVLKRFGKMPHQPAKTLLEILGRNHNKEFASAFDTMYQKYKDDHVLETAHVGHMGDVLAIQNFNEVLPVEKLALQIYRQQLRSCQYTLLSDKPTQKSMNSLSGGGSKVKYQWYSKDEYDKLTPEEKKELRDMIREKGPAPGTPPELVERFNQRKKAGGDYKRKQWSSQPSGNKAGANLLKKLRRSGGVAVVDGSLHMLCGSCGDNSTHTTKGHSEWAKNPGGYCLPANHPGTALQIKLFGSAGKKAGKPSNSNSDEPDYAELLEKVNMMQTGFKAVKNLTTEVLDMEMDEEFDPTCAEKRRSLAQAWKDIEFLN